MPIQLLIVDDSALMRRQLTQVFQAEGDFEIRLARNGKEAVEENQAFQPDVVTLDINMPEMDGVTALAQIMASRSVPVVMVSSLTQKGAHATFEALALGAVDYVAKPGGTISLSIDEVRDDLVAKVRAAARARPRRSSAPQSASRGIVERMREERAAVGAARRSFVRRAVANSEGLVIIGLCIMLLLGLQACQRASMGRHSFNQQASEDIQASLSRMQTFLQEELTKNPLSSAMFNGQTGSLYNRWIRQPFGVYVYEHKSRLLWTRHALAEERLQNLLMLPDQGGIYAGNDHTYTIFSKKISGPYTIVTAIEVKEALEGSLGTISGLQISSAAQKNVYNPADLSIAIDPTENIKNQQAVLLGISLVFCFFLLIFLFYVLYQYQVRRRWSDGRLTLSWFAGLFAFWIITQTWLKPLYLDFPVWGTIIPYLIYITMALTSVIFLYRITADRHLVFARSTLRSRYGYTLFTYLLIICSFLITARYAYFLVIQTGVALDFDNFLYSSAVSLVTIMSIILFCAFCYILHNRFISEILTLEIPIRHRLWLYLGAYILAIPIFYLLDLPVGYGFFIIFTAIYILLYELFLEARNPSMTWMITWLIIFSGFLAILLFKYNWAKDLQTRLVIPASSSSHRAASNTAPPPTKRPRC